MAISGALTGAVTSWAGTANTRLIDNVGGRPFRWAFSNEADSFIARTMGGTGGATARPGVVSITGEIEGELGTPVMGDFGSITFASGYTTNPEGYDLTLSAPAGSYVAFGSGVRLHLPPSQFDWGGSMRFFHDGTTPVVNTGAASAAATFMYQDLVTDNTLAGSIIATRLGVTAEQSGLPMVDYSFVGDGALTQSTNAVGIFPDGVVAAPVTGSLVLTADTGQTFTFGAIWTGVTLTCRRGETVRVRIAFAASTLNTGTWIG